MKRLPETPPPDQIARRIARSLAHLNRSFFPQDVCEEMEDLFLRVTEPCFQVNSTLDSWKSALCTDGTPIELALSVSEAGAASFRFVIDTQCGPCAPDQAAEAIDRYWPIVGPGGRRVEELRRDLCEKHIMDQGGAVRSYVGHSVKFPRGARFAGRLYFNTDWRSRSQVEAILATFVSQDDLARLHGPSLAEVRIFGTGFDLDEEGINRVKAYLSLDTCSPEAAEDLAEATVGARASSLAAMVEMMIKLRGGHWRVPQMPAAFVLSSGDSFRELKLSLPLFMWGWDASALVRPALAAILERWGAGGSRRKDFGPESQEGPPWRFVLTYLSLGVSTEDESICLYFRPVKRSEQAIGAETSPASGGADEPELTDGALERFLAKFCL